MAHTALLKNSNLSSRQEENSTDLDVGTKRTVAPLVHIQIKHAIHVSIRRI